MTELVHVHGSHNSFYLLDQTLFETPLSQKQFIQLAQKLCQQKDDWPGADGLLVVDEPTHAGPLGKMTVVNADGSIASMCGNGLRTVARYLSEREGQTAFTVETAESDLKVRQEANFAPGVPAFSVEISPIRFNKKAFPFDHLEKERIFDTKLPVLHDYLHFTAIAVPNPHLISFVETDEDLTDTLGQLGQRLNAENPYFPDGVNVNFAKILGKNTLFVQTYERGVGFTNACGTGMSATSYAFSMIHPELVDVSKELTIYNPGGMVKTRIHQDKEQPWIELIGNATFIDKVTIPEEYLSSGHFDLAQLRPVQTGEETNYNRFVANLPH
ncbi:diaminopimelate epimerase [Fructobacillus fructosus]|uniref:diaminopimelate epimerase n=1 Tax=Fructobacillus fructosus TaxID=1631 RepID=UPI001658A864|nr:diaminopimelate epimerase [Fructobacillus fructosus]MBC9118811.1 diaminopimelate epimerase [Fructobacillus fructosus]MBD9365475.1 diaminopimelate epimerase [Leuconostoc mesenteroides]MCK8638393.1 diaminopimelate epimerase [Fructobacillus fructosus]CAK1236508.1 Diaminopimelate epimerase (DapF) [Fructobacillus fructosus]